MAILDFILGKKTEVAAPLTTETAKGPSLQDIIAPSALKIESKEFTLGDVKGRTYFIMSYPRYLTDNWLSPLINLDKVFDVGIHISPVDTAEVMKKFQRKVAEVQSQIMIREEKGMVRDPMLETAHEDLEGLRDDLMQGQEKMFEVGVYISIYARDDKDLDRVEKEIKSILESKLISMRPAYFQQDRVSLRLYPSAKTS